MSYLVEVVYQLNGEERNIFVDESTPVETLIRNLNVSQSLVGGFVKPTKNSKTVLMTLVGQGLQKVFFEDFAFAPPMPSTHVLPVLQAVPKAAFHDKLSSGQAINATVITKGRSTDGAEVIRSSPAVQLPYTIGEVGSINLSRLAKLQVDSSFLQRVHVLHELTVGGRQELVNNRPIAVPPTDLETHCVICLAGNTPSPTGSPAAPTPKSASSDLKVARDKVWGYKCGFAECSIFYCTGCVFGPCGVRVTKYDGGQAHLQCLQHHPFHVISQKKMNQMLTDLKAADEDRSAQAAAAVLAAEDESREALQQATRNTNV